MNVNTKLATAVSAALMTFAASNASAEISLYDYTEATSAYEDAYLNGQFSATGGNQDQAAYNAELSLEYDRVFSSPNRNVGVTFYADGAISRDSTGGAKSESTYLVNGSVTADNYFRPGSKGAFWYGSGNIGLKKDANDPYAKVGVGLGYGRVVNVTPMAKAIRLVEALREQGALKAEPSVAVYQQVANIVSRENEYQSKFGYSSYNQHWIADMEKALGGNLGAGGVIKANDVLQNEFISTRKYGWLVRAGVGAVVSNYDGSNGGDPSLDFGAEYHRPLNNRTQFSNVASLSTIYGNNDASYQLNNAMTLTHELSDKIDWENAWLMDYSNSGDPVIDDVITNTLASTFRYYLDNQLDLTVTAKASKVEDGIANNNQGVDTSLNMGVSYRLR